MRAIYQEEIFDNISFSNKNNTKDEYDTCHFINCDFSNSDLSDALFTECIFENCNLSTAKINNTSLQKVSFKSCKMIGIQFDECNGFGLSVSFHDCVLNHSSFYQLNLSNNRFSNCQLKEVDFSLTDLTGSIFHECNLSRATFDRTNLRQADLQTTINYSINPNQNNIQKAKFSLSTISGLLDCYDIEIMP